MCSVLICYNREVWSWYPCGGGVEYLHRSPASRRRQCKGESQIWDSKLWSRVPKDSDPRKTIQVRTSSIYKRQTCALVREGAPQTQDRNGQSVINIWSWAPDGARYQDLLIDWPSRNVNLIWLWHQQTSSVEAGSNTSTVALRVVGGEKKGRLESETVKYGREYHGTRTRQWMRWRGPATILNDRSILSSERMLYKDYNRRCSIEKKFWPWVSRGSAPRRTVWQ
jgi:hypothetical protein